MIRFVREGADALSRNTSFWTPSSTWRPADGFPGRGAFFGDMLQMKPVISPLAEGVRKMGVVRNRTGQLRFALEKLTAH